MEEEPKTTTENKDIPIEIINKINTMLNKYIESVEGKRQQPSQSTPPALKENSQTTSLLQTIPTKITQPKAQPEAQLEQK